MYKIAIVVTHNAVGMACSNLVGVVWCPLCLRGVRVRSGGWEGEWVRSVGWEGEWVCREGEWEDGLQTIRGLLRTLPSAL